MIRALSTYRTLIEALDALGKAKRSTDALLHTACVAFVAAVAEMTGERCVLWIGETPIAREK